MSRVDTITVRLNLEMALPTMPNFIRIRDANRTHLDEAIAHGDEVTIDVARLDNEGVEEFIKKWGEAFREHVKARRTRPAEPVARKA